ncbi:MAG: hypothetical protein GY699_09480 [Desulfobacteraceae bacterium]|nr:hypothetical protein [Desulfobacteraceae bacterium]
MQKRMKVKEARLLTRGLKKILKFVNSRYNLETETDLRHVEHFVQQAIYYMTDFTEELRHDERLAQGGANKLSGDNDSNYVMSFGGSDDGINIDGSCSNNKQNN